METETAVYLSEGAQQPIFFFVSCDVDYVVSSLRLTGWENYRLWLTVGFWVLAHHCPLSQSSMREGSLTTEEEEEEEAGWLKGEERVWRVGLKKMRREGEETWTDREVKEGREGEEGEVEEGGRLGWVPGSIPPLLSRPFWAATSSHLGNVINEKAFRRDGGLDSGFRLWPTPADAAKPSRILFELIGCHFQVKGTRQVFSFFLSVFFLHVSVSPSEELAALGLMNQNKVGFLSLLERWLSEDSRFPLHRH